MHGLSPQGCEPFWFSPVPLWQGRSRFSLKGLIGIKPARRLSDFPQSVIGALITDMPEGVRFLVSADLTFVSFYLRLVRLSLRVSCFYMGTNTQVFVPTAP